MKGLSLESMRGVKASNQSLGRPVENSMSGICQELCIKSTDGFLSADMAAKMYTNAHISFSDFITDDTVMPHPQISSCNHDLSDASYQCG